MQLVSSNTSSVTANDWKWFMTANFVLQHVAGASSPQQLLVQTPKQSKHRRQLATLMHPRTQQEAHPQTTSQMKVWTLLIL